MAVEEPIEGLQSWNASQMKDLGEIFNLRYKTIL